MSADVRGNATAELAGEGELTPGEHLRAEIERLGLDQVAVSQATGVSRQSINNIVNGRQPISRAMAGKLGRLTGHSSDYWLRASFPRTAGAARTSAAASEGEARPLGVGIMVNHQIVRAVKDGIIGIDPFDDAHVQPACDRAHARRLRHHRRRREDRHQRRRALPAEERPHRQCQHARVAGIPAGLHRPRRRRGHARERRHSHLARLSDRPRISRQSAILHLQCRAQGFRAARRQSDHRRRDHAARRHPGARRQRARAAQTTRAIRVSAIRWWRSSATRCASG